MKTTDEVMIEALCKQISNNAIRIDIAVLFGDSNEDIDKRMEWLESSVSDLRERWDRVKAKRTRWARFRRKIGFP